LLRYGRIRTRYRFTHRQNLGQSRRSPLDFSDDRSIGCARRGHGYEPVLAPQTIDQSAFPRAQHLLRQREKIPEGPYQIRALHKIRLYISGSDRRVHFKNAIGEFFNPHILVHLEKTAYAAFALKRAIIAPSSGIGKQSFYLKEQNIYVAWINLRKRLEMAARN
jgi:hypothetical protein